MAPGDGARREGEVLLLQARAGRRRVAETAPSASPAGACGSSASASPASTRGIITSACGTITGARVPMPFDLDTHHLLAGVSFSF